MAYPTNNPEEFDLYWTVAEPLSKSTFGCGCGCNPEFDEPCTDCYICEARRYAKMLMKRLKDLDQDNVTSRDVTLIRGTYNAMILKIK